MPNHSPTLTFIALSLHVADVVCAEEKLMRTSESPAAAHVRTHVRLTTIVRMTAVLCQNTSNVVFLALADQKRTSSAHASPSQACVTHAFGCNTRETWTV